MYFFVTTISLFFWISLNYFFYQITKTFSFFTGKKLKNITTEQGQLLDKFRTVRPEFPKMPIHLSDRSNPKNYSKKMRKAEKGTSGEEGCWENFGLNCLAVFACIFD